MRGLPTRRVTFPVVSHKQTRTIRCANEACRKKMVRVRKFEQTINPFNTNPDGSQKTALQIKAEVVAQGKEWEAKAGESQELCQACQAAHGE